MPASLPRGKDGQLGPTWIDKALRKEKISKTKRCEQDSMAALVKRNSSSHGESLYWQRMGLILEKEEIMQHIEFVKGGNEWRKAERAWTFSRVISFLFLPIAPRQAVRAPYASDIVTSANADMSPASASCEVAAGMGGSRRHRISFGVRSISFRKHEPYHPPSLLSSQQKHLNQLQQSPPLRPRYPEFLHRPWLRHW